MIGLSLLSTGHPPSFQPRWVRPSTGSYPRFSLPMDSSPGFASAARDCVALFGLAFATARFAARPRRAPQLAGSFYKRHAVTPEIGAPTACRQAVSGTVSLPSRGAFHLSLAVLVRYRSQESIQGWRVDPPDSHRVSRARRYSGAGRRAARVRVRGFYPVPPALPGRSAPERLCNRHVSGPTTPAGLGPRRFALGPRSLAATRGISF